MGPDSKLYIVVTVLAVILVGIFAYLFFMDRKVRKIEKEIKEHDQKQHEGDKGI
ncbi:MAG: CcmD family protein [Bacteroidota bacterium]